ncbi:hypothetical protein BDV98DRAFT_112252 [Pterulicium gracile]|uniref:Uncharacterized protein n=1 Tax=Pterulicium gracile TaxID=1884261 RepID=A0A5C3QIP9_9AGAR|nr:hypothetical protein BDV98DRAFT_112252 [Pterula gracilis]
MSYMTKCSGDDAAVNPPFLLDQFEAAVHWWGCPRHGRNEKTSRVNLFHSIPQMSHSSHLPTSSGSFAGGHLALSAGQSLGSYRRRTGTHPALVEGLIRPRRCPFSSLQVPVSWSHPWTSTVLLAQPDSPPLSHSICSASQALRVLRMAAPTRSRRLCTILW